MKRFFVAVSTLVVLLSSCGQQHEPVKEFDYTQYVNPFIGTDFTGNTYPGASVPFGMVQLSPDNGISGWDRIAGYFYPDSTIAGFSHTHLSGTGAGDLYDFSFMPVTFPYKEAAGDLGIHSKFSHDEEGAEPGYYWVNLKDYGIKVELTSTERTGIQRYTFPKSDAAVFLNLKKAMNWDFTKDSQVEVVDSVTIQGYRMSEGWAPDQRLFFVTKFSKPFKAFNMDTTEILYPADKRRTGTAYVARFDFDMNEGEQLVVRTAISGVDIDGAKKNLAAEATTNDFDGYRAAAKSMWNKELSKMTAVGPNHDDLVNFYTGLYHSMLAPTIYSDVDGRYRGPDMKIHQTDGWINYSTFSLWDTYRTAHPLYTYMHPERVKDMVLSFLAFYDEAGRLPVWNFQGNETDMMIGYHSVPVIVEAYLKGIKGFDAERALEACVKTANIDEYRSIGLYKQLGYVPYNKEGESVSKTLEYAFDDYAIALMAKAMGKDSIYNDFYRRSQFYRNQYNKETGFMQPRDDKGNWIANFDPKEYTEHITESNGWQYVWYVPQDVEGLIEMAGGKEPFAAKLDSMFTLVPEENEELPIFSTGMIGQYAHGNEPSHHVIYLYNAVNQPWKTQQYAAQVMNDLYRNAPHGICGNEDCGQMSSWYVFSAMGIYPVNPVALRYEIGTPLFESVSMKLDNGKEFKVIAHNFSKENIYVQGVKVNGQVYDKSYITNDQIMSGATVEFEMGNKPGPVWYNNY